MAYRRRFYCFFYLLCCSTGTNHSTGFGKRLPVYLGEISYGIYILQVPVYRFLTQTFELKTIVSATSFLLFLSVRTTDCFSHLLRTD